MTASRTSHGDWEAAVARAATEPLTLRLYVAGASPRSLHATERLRDFCDRYLRGRHSLEVLDLYEHPELARSAGVIGAPTLVKEKPLPRRQLIGDMGDEQRLLQMLGLTAAAGSG